LFTVKCADDWGYFFDRLDNSEKEKIAKKIDRLAFPLKARHLRHSLPYFVVEAGQYRIVFEQTGNTRILVFVGNHKQYEKWPLEHRL